jgi:hypothetical protein
MMFDCSFPFCLPDIVVKSDLEQFASLLPTDVNVQIFSAKSANGEPLFFEEISAGKWKYNGCIEL